MDEYGKLPIENGLDVIVVDSLAFKRYCDIALLLNKKVVVVTDNDGDIQKNIKNKYADYYDNPNLIFIYEKNEELHTIEPSVAEVNFDTPEHERVFKAVIFKRDSMVHKTKEDVISFMEHNKAEWALRVFDSNQTIIYPEYIRDAIKEYD
ncbi:MAG: hypothetical protein MRZ94_05700 [Oscillospiraceae bacterium]|nr:hypothetical protein [Oscillospiraceae bacterium]